MSSTHILKNIFQVSIQNNVFHSDIPFIIGIVLCLHLPLAVRMMAASTFLLVSIIPSCFIVCVCVYIFTQILHTKETM